MQPGIQTQTADNKMKGTKVDLHSQPPGSCLTGCLKQVPICSHAKLQQGTKFQAQFTVGYVGNLQVSVLYDTEK